MKVIMVKEDWHGFLCIAKDFPTAIKWLVDNHWIAADHAFWGNNKKVLISELMGIENPTNEEMIAWPC